MATQPHTQNQCLGRKISVFATNISNNTSHNPNHHPRHKTLPPGLNFSSSISHNRNQLITICNKLILETTRAYRAIQPKTHDKKRPLKPRCKALHPGYNFSNSISRSQNQHIIIVAQQKNPYIELVIFPRLLIAKNLAHRRARQPSAPCLTKTSCAPHECFRRSDNTTRNKLTPATSPTYHTTKSNPTKKAPRPKPRRKNLLSPLCNSNNQPNSA